MSYRYENLYIMHYGVGHDKGGHSGRYPWGSGENPYGGKKNIKSIFRTSAKVKLGEEARRIQNSYSGSAGAKERDIGIFVQNAFEKSNYYQKYDRDAQDFFLNIDEETKKDRTNFLKELLDKDTELSVDLHEYKMYRDENVKSGKDFIKKMGAEYDIRKLYSPNAMDGTISFLKNFVDKYYNYPTNNLSDLEELDELMAWWMW